MGKAITEREFQRQVLDLAKLCGWRRVHFRAARTNKGWRTPIEGDGVGFPDTIMVSRTLRRVIYAELKVPPNKLSPEQVEWAEWLLGAGQEVFCWYPTDWQQIEKVLGYKGAR